MNERFSNTSLAGNHQKESAEIADPYDETPLTPVATAFHRFSIASSGSNRTKFSLQLLGKCTKQPSIYMSGQMPFRENTHVRIGNAVSADQTLPVRRCQFAKVVNQGKAGKTLWVIPLIPRFTINSLTRLPRMHREQLRVIVWTRLVHNRVSSRELRAR